MAYPPGSIAADKTDGTAVTTDHPNHHNDLASAVNDIVTELGSGPKGAAADVTARLSTLDTTVSGKLTASSNLSDVANASTSRTNLGLGSIATQAADSVAITGGSLTNLTGVGIGATTSLTDRSIDIDVTRTDTDGGLTREVELAGTLTYSTTANGTWQGLAMVPGISTTVNLTAITGMLFQPSVSGAATTTTATGISAVVQSGVSHTMTTAIGLKGQVSAILGTVTTGICLDAQTANTSGTFTTAIGLRITQLAGGSTVWGMQVGDYQSYHEGDLRIGAVSGGSSASPSAKLDVIEPAIGDPVAKLTSVATNDDVTETVRQYRAATTDATVTTIATVAVPASTTSLIEARVVARRTGGSAGAADDGAGYLVAATFKGASGTVAQIGSTTAVATHESQAAWNVSFTVSGGNALLQVTGAANNNVTWHATVRVYAVGS